MYPLRNLFDNVTNLSMSTRAGSEIVTQSPRICIQPHMRILSTEGYQPLKRNGANGPISNMILILFVIQVIRLCKPGKVWYDHTIKLISYGTIWIHIIWSILYGANYMFFHIAIHMIWFILWLKIAYSHLSLINPFLHKSILKWILKVFDLLFFFWKIRSSKLRNEMKLVWNSCCRSKCW